MNELSKTQMILHGLSIVAMVAFVRLYVSYNAPGSTDVPVIAILGVVYVAIFLLATPGLGGGRHSLIPEKVSRVLYAATAVGLPMLFLNDEMWSGYHLLSFTDYTVITLLTSCLLLVISSIISYTRNKELFNLVTVLALISLVFVILTRIIVQGPLT